MALKWPDKDPDAIKNYGVDWATRLIAGETIMSSTWSVLPDTLTIGDSEIYIPTISGSICVCWLSGGVENETYSVANRVLTSRGIVDDQSVLIRVRSQ